MLASTFKITIVDSSRDLTGAFIAAIQLASLLRKHYQVDFIINSRCAPAVKAALHRERLSYNELPILELSRKPLSILAYIPRLIANGLRLHSLLRSRACDCFIVNDYYNMLGLIAKIFSPSTFVVTYVRLLPEASPRILHIIWLQVSLVISYRVVAVSKSLSSKLVKSKKIVQLYDSHQKPTPFTRPTSTTSTLSQCLRILYLSNYIPGKGHIMAIKSFSLSLKTTPGVQLCFYGSTMGLKKNQEYKQYLIQLVKGMGLLENVHFNGQVEKPSANFFSDFDISMMLSERESLSMVVVESMLNNLPVIATKCGGPEELIEDGYTGYLVSLGDTKYTAYLISKLACDGMHRSSLSKAALHSINEKFHPSATLEMYSTLANKTYSLGRQEIASK